MVAVRTVGVFMIVVTLAGCDLLNLLRRPKPWKNGTYVVTNSFPASGKRRDSDPCEEAVRDYGSTIWVKKMTCASNGSTEGVLGVSCVALNEKFTLTSFVYADPAANQNVSVWHGPGPVWHDDDFRNGTVHCWTEILLSLVE